jgi:poly-beta-1,6-N-acetyl-D-glucosamine synthase
LFIHNPKTGDQKAFPPISILISAYNEEKVIAQRIENIKNLNYDFSKVELIIGSDCSTDKTNTILSQISHEYNWIKIKILPTRTGKANVLNDLVQIAKNEILVFTDANTIFEKDALINLVSKFSDQKVGGICGKLILENPSDNFDKSNREKLYWIYETQIKKLEGHLGILVAANGGIYAIRKNLFSKFPPDHAITDDLYQTLSVLDQGYKFLYAIEAIAKEEVAQKLTSEFQRKMRFAGTNFQTLKQFPSLLLGEKFLVSYALWSHKILRWFVPMIAIFLFASNLALINHQKLYFITFIMQSSFYLSVFIGFVLNIFKINVIFFSVSYYYFITNLALLIGFVKFLTGKHSYTWNSTPR